MDQQSPTSKLLLALAILVLLGCGFSTNGSSGKDEEAWFRTARVQMVEQQLRPRGIRDERVLQAMATIPRHLFVPPTLRTRASVIRFRRLPTWRSEELERAKRGAQRVSDLLDWK